MAYYMHITDHCISDLNRTNVNALSEKLAAYESNLAQRSDSKAAPIIALCNSEQDLAAIETAAADIRKKFKHVIICGAGGSGLSGRVLANLHLYSNAPRLYTLDNIDPSAIDALIRNCPPEESFVIVISKSGSTAETLSQLYTLLTHFKKTLGEKTGDHFMAITMKSDSPMVRAVKENKLQMLEHPADIGGRFSLFTAVGLLPAALAGVNIRKLRKGAAASAGTLGKGEHPARLGAALQYEAMQRGHSMSVMLPYCERLSGFSAWYRQSWAESLGKGGKGTTPIRSVGTTDQHSQLQLYLDGPNDKFFTLIFHDRAGTGQKIHAPHDTELDYLQGKTTGDVMEAEQEATLKTLIAHNRPVRLIRIKSLDEEVLGALIMHFMLEIFFMAKLLGVNAFDQPAVEEGKVLARAALLGTKP
jgi:glucose-6-phosphate isomerase